MNSALVLARARELLVYSWDAESHPLSHPLSASMVSSLERKDLLALVSPRKAGLHFRARLTQLPERIWRVCVRLCRNLKSGKAAELPAV